MITPSEMAAMVDHTLLKPDATAADVEKLCAEARQHGFFSVCVNPVFVPQVKSLLRGSAVKVCCVVGFPLGAQDPQIKLLEARKAIREGAQEVDMVINVGALKGKDDALVLRDIRGVVEEKAKAGGYQAVLDTAAESINQAPVVVYTSLLGGADDLSDGVLKVLNANSPADAPKKDEEKKEDKK